MGMFSVHGSSGHRNINSHHLRRCSASLSKGLIMAKIMYPCPPWVGKILTRAWRDKNSLQSAGSISPYNLYRGQFCNTHYELKNGCKLLKAISLLEMCPSRMHGIHYFYFKILENSVMSRELVKQIIVHSSKGINLSSWKRIKSLSWILPC